MNNFLKSIKYLKYVLKAKTSYGIHSPFVFELMNKVIYNQNLYYAFEEIEKKREQLLVSQEIIEVTELGTGGKLKSKTNRKIKDIVKYSAKSAKYGRLLFRLVHNLKPLYILEFGTSLGISTIYLSMANQNTKIVTFEGCPNTANIARKNFKEFNLNNINLSVGDIDNTLDSVLGNLPQIDLVFFDANHTQKATLNYFERCLLLSHKDSLFIFDDIHWSGEMENAWSIIKKHPRSIVTIDLFFIGLVFFRKEQPKQDFTIFF